MVRRGVRYCDSVWCAAQCGTAAGSGVGCCAVACMLLRGSDAGFGNDYGGVCGALRGTETGDVSRGLQHVDAVRDARVPGARDHSKQGPRQGGRLVGPRRAHLRDALRVHAPTALSSLLPPLSSLLSRPLPRLALFSFILALCSALPRPLCPPCSAPRTALFALSLLYLCRSRAVDDR
eukprot:781891-Rhodomonas_salina.1